MSEMEASDGGALPVILRRHGRCCSDRKAHGWQGAHVHSPSACRKKRLPGFLKTDLKVLLEKHAAAVTAVRQGGSAKGPEAGDPNNRSQLHKGRYTVCQPAQGATGQAEVGLKASLHPPCLV